MKGRFLCVVVFSLTLFAVSSHLKAQYPKLNFRNYSEQDGLSLNYVRSIYQDRDGFMWFGTPLGIDKFDGKNFKSYSDILRDSTSGNYQLTYSIIEDDDGMLWISTYTNGIIVFDKYKEKITRFKHDEDNPASLSNDRVLDIFEDYEKNIWVATAGGGLNLFQKETGTFVHFRHNPDDPQSIGSDYLSSITCDSKNNIWIAAVDGVVSKLNTKTGLFENTVLPLPEHSIYLPRGFSPILYVDSNDNVLIGSILGLCFISADTGEITYISSLSGNKDMNSYVNGISEMDNGVYFISSYLEGLYLLNVNTGESMLYSNRNTIDYFISVNNIMCMYQSNDKSLWVGSLSGGVSVSDLAFRQFELLEDKVNAEYKPWMKGNRLSMCTSPDNKILISNGKRNITSYDPKDNTTDFYLTNLPCSEIVHISCNKSDNILIGTSNDGLILYDAANKDIIKKTSVSNNNNSLASNNIYIAMEDSRQNVWIGYAGEGLDLWDRESDQISHFVYDPNDTNTISSDIVYKIYEDRNNTVWTSTQQGLCYYDREIQKFRRVVLYDQAGREIKVKTILDIFEDSEGNMWLGTYDALVHLDRDDFTVTTYTSDKSPLYVILNILEDEDHNLWMTSFNKVLKFTINTKEFSAYNMTIGQISPAFASQSSDFLNGHFYFGSSSVGVYTFQQQNFKRIKEETKLFLTDLVINNESIGFTSGNNVLSDHINFADSIMLNYNQSTFAISFASLEYLFPEKIQYAYKLEGYDRDWYYSGNINSAAYRKVTPGNYTFRLMATNLEGEWNNTVTEVTVIVKPPFWSTWWFRILIVSFFMLALYFIYYLRNKSLIKQKKVLEDKVVRRTQALNEANRSLSEQQEELKQQNELLSEMSEKILSQNKELELHYNELERLVQDRTEELEKAKNKAEESDRLKSAFLANMSHEIRTPMNAIVGFANLLKEEDLTDDEKIEFVEIINSNSDTLLVLIDDILDLSLIEADQLAIKNEVIGVNEFLDNLYSAFALMNSKEEIEVKLNNELYAQELKIFSDKVRLKQIITNLMSNAIKFTDMGTVELGLKKVNGDLVFYVNDTGLGIPKSELKTIFDRFRKSDYEHSTLLRGTGLGLTISKALAELLDGRLEVESEVGKGSVFSLILPEAVLSADEPLVKEIIARDDIKNLDRKRILIVEDEKANYMYARKMLAQIDVVVDWAENGMKAVNMLEEGRYFDIILMDIKMPEMDGYEATRIIKASNPKQIVIAITAYARPEDRRRFIDAGFDDYIPKPIKPNDFRGVIRRYIS